MSTRSYAPNEKWEILLEALGSSRGPDEVCMRRGISLIELRRWLQQAREGALVKLSGASLEGGSGLDSLSRAAQPPLQPTPSPVSSAVGAPAATPAVAAPSTASAAVATPPAPPAPVVASPPAPPAAAVSAPPSSAPVSAPSPEVISEAEAWPSRDEIDAMFSMVSHELKEPLRGVKAISQFMREDFADVLPERGVNYLETLQTTVERMQRLVDGLSEFARCDQLVKELGPVPLSPLIERVRNELQSFLAVRRGSVAVDSRLPTLVGDAIALGRAFRHLIHNGLKFNLSPAPRVEVISIAGTPGDAMCTILVKDNGIGIDPRHFGRIFELFQRLHRYDEYPGAGVGLTVARKIILAHKGEISLESTPGQGSTIRIRLPSRSC